MPTKTRSLYIYMDLYVLEESASGVQVDDIKQLIL